ncbi:MAG: F0F1 ATP synthase subunit gamma [Gammaproteobacteria bacterium]|nr:F0F1 ATP synthase subunit gamma [Gammaproteobacteria bacterium]MBU1440715.1 F0F1 ATP synthase subunit gamma [Gammaproteobacteria bacterium]MBU2287241.1 F0F1 ATP synthase subunit gamma [Gammaproteobacteria bacterium]
MSDSIATLRRQLTNAGDLHSVVRTMKAVAASSIGQYERSVLALLDYDRTVTLGLGECFRQARAAAAGQPASVPIRRSGRVCAIVFGSDQGLVGQFNDVIADHAAEGLRRLGGTPHVWAVGERVHARLSEAGLTMGGLYAVPASVDAIAPLVGQIQIDADRQPGDDREAQMHVFHNRPLSGSLYEPVGQRLLPLDMDWEQRLAAVPWSGKALPQAIGQGAAILGALVREYLFISLFRACAESLASENASRLAAMGRADRNIGERLEALQAKFHRLRQSSIDEELFDVTSGYEALAAHGGESSLAAGTGRGVE